MRLAMMLATGMLGGRDPSASALFARFTTPPTAARKTQINAAIVALKNAGIWPLLDALYLTAAADSQAATCNWVANAYNLTASGAPVFTADRGYAGNGTTAYLDSGFNPASSGGKYVQNSASLFAYQRGAANDAASIIAISDAGTTASLLPNYFGDFLGRINAGAYSTSTGVHGPGFFAANRLVAGTQTLYKGAAGADFAVASTGPGNANITLLKDAFGFAATTTQIACAGFGAGLTPTQEAALFSAISTYLTAVGA